MEGGDPNTTIPQLLERIARLETQLAQQAARTETGAPKEVVHRLAVLEKKVKRFGYHLARLSQNFIDDRAATAERFEHSFERIKGLEVSVFPHLANDIESLYRIIGGRGVPAETNPLDVRQVDSGLPDSAAEI
ncbi:MAG TPA: hypothetical protein VGG72_20030 [Bryobacteraceae bacterium]|jgi:hypothetical protein